MTTSTTLPPVGLEVLPLWPIDEPAWFMLELPHAVAITVTARSPSAVLIRTGFVLFSLCRSGGFQERVSGVPDRRSLTWCRTSVLWQFGQRTGEAART